MISGFEFRSERYHHLLETSAYTLIASTLLSTIINYYQLSKHNVNNNNVELDNISDTVLFLRTELLSW